MVRASHQELTAISDPRNALLVVQSKGLSITSVFSQHHLGEVREVYSSMLEGKGLLAIDTVLAS